MEGEVTRLLPFCQWNVSTTSAKCMKKGSETILNYQSVSRQINLIRYYCDPISELPRGYALLNHVNIARKTPELLYSQISPSVYCVYQKWISEIINQPVIFAKAIANYFENDTKDGFIFSSVIFPTLFFQYATEDFQNLAFQFLRELLNCNSSSFESCFSSFILSCSTFTMSLWKNFDEEILRVQHPSSGDYFHSLLSALRKASSALSEYQIRIIILFSETRHSDFVRYFFLVYLRKTFDIWHKKYSEMVFIDDMRKLLNFIGGNPNVPQGRIISNVFKNVKQTAYLLPLPQQTDIPFIFSGIEFSILQGIISKNPDLVGIKYLEAFGLPLTIISNVEPMIINLITKDIFPNKMTLMSKNRLVFDKMNKKPNVGNPKVSREWSSIKSLADKCGILPMNLFTKEESMCRSCKYIDYIKSFTDEVFTYGLVETYNELVQRIDTFEELLSELEIYELYKKNLEYKEYHLALHLYALSFKIIGTDLVHIDSTIEEDQTIDVKPCQAIRRYTTKQSIAIFKSETNLELGELITEKTIAHFKITDRKQSNHINPSSSHMDLIKKRKDLVAFGTHNTSTLLKSTIHMLTSRCLNDDLKFFLTIKKLDEMEFAGIIWPVINSHYLNSINIARLKRIGVSSKYKDIHNAILKEAENIDILIYMKSGTSLLQFLAISKDLSRICEFWANKACVQKKLEEVSHHILLECLLMSTTDIFFQRLAELHETNVQTVEDFELDHRDAVSLNFLIVTFNRSMKLIDLSLSEKVKKLFKKY